MTFKEYTFLILSDLYRISGKKDVSTLLRHVLFVDTYKYVFWMRTCRYIGESRMFIRFWLMYVATRVLRHYSYKFGIAIPYATAIGSGFYIGHFGTIVVHRKCVIGRNCNISQGVTLGQANRGRNRGTPTLGDNVYIGPGAKVIGAVVVGNNAAIGANCVVTKNVPDNSVVVGVPGRVISQRGTAGYVNRTDYD